MKLKIVISELDYRCQSGEFAAEVGQLAERIKSLFEQKWGDTFVIYNHSDFMVPFFEIYNLKERRAIFMIESNCRSSQSYRWLSCAISISNQSLDLLLMTKLEGALRDFGFQEKLDEISCVLLYE